MARAVGKKRTVVQRQSNAIGFSKRQARKKVRQSTSVDDVYEFQPEKVRRSKVALRLTKEELAEFGHDDATDSGDDEHRDGQPQPRLIGQNSDDEGLDSDEDEDIDSDAAFGESDEETFAGYGFTRKGQPSRKPKQRPLTTKRVHFEVNLDESDEGGLADDPNNSEGSGREVEEEGRPDEFFDILDILDGRADPLSDDEPSVMSSRKNETPHASGEEEEEEEEVEDDDDNEDGHDMDIEEADQFAPSDDEANINALHNLGQFISNLNSSAKRQNSEAGGAVMDEDNPPRKKRKLLQERNEAGAENEFTASGETKLNFEDLLAPLEDQSDSLSTLKKSAKVLTSSKNKTFPAPLPQRTQDRFDREAAYEQTKQEVDKWQATIKQIKEAEHLSFPLQAPAKSGVSSSELIAKFKPTTELETSIERLLKKANLLDSQREQGNGSLPANPLTAETALARTSEVRKMRELMFRADAKAKRLAKIKSKTYRRLKKKQKQKLTEKFEADEDSAEDEEKRLKREIERARERATLKHKNTGKWAKAMKGRGELDEDQRQEVLEMLQRGEDLRKKIHAKGSDDSEDEDDSDDDTGDEGQIRASAFDEVARIVEDEVPEHSKKSLFSMKFMKDAMARDHKKAQDIADEFLKDLAGSDGGVLSDASTDDLQDQPQRTNGRFSFRPGAPSQPTSLRLPQQDAVGDAESASAISSHTLSSQSTVVPPSQSKATTAPTSTASNTTPSVTPSDHENPWLNIQQNASKIARKKNEIIVGKSSSMVEKSKNRLRKHKEKHESEREKARDEAVVEITMSDILNLRPEDAQGVHPPVAPGARGITTRESGDSDEDADANSEVEEQERKLVEKKRKGKGKAKDQGAVKPFTQRDLVSLAFAGDKVVQDFQETKQREILEDAPKEVDTTLPGWGSWGGTGAKKAPPKPFLVKKVAGIDPRSREDYGKTHVIISEKRDKKAAKYMIKDLPYPYTSKAQYERSLQTPVGTEWNTRLGFQRGTLPRVVKKPGAVIEPLVKMS